jgi:hypothetical protein
MIQRTPRRFNGSSDKGSNQRSDARSNDMDLREMMMVALLGGRTSPLG